MLFFRTALPLCCFIALPALLRADDLVPVGVARADITPKYAVRLSGYGSRRAESNGVAQPIWAKALAIGVGADASLILTVDNLGVPEEFTAEVARRVNVPRERVALCSSHTHSAPMLTNVAPTLFGLPIPPGHQQHIDQYTKELGEALAKVARAALDDRRPGCIAWAKGKVTFAANRRTAGGPVDHDLPVLRVTDADGKLRALLVNYACHCTTLGGEFNQVHGDWAGYAQELIERASPGAVAMIAIGCGADANPAPRGNVKLAEQHGEAISREVSRLLQGEWKPLPGKIAAQFKKIDLDFDKLPTRAEWEARAKQPGAVGYHAQVQLKKLDAGQTLPTKLSYPIQTWTFGDKLSMVFLGGEVVVDYALRLKKEYDSERLWVNAYSNDDPCYIASVRILREGGYEGGAAMIYYDRPTRFAPNVEQLIFDELHKQIPAGFKAPKDPREFPPPKSPKDSLACIQLKPGFRAELVASEPLISSPVAIDWGPDGKLWVIEMYDYPTGVDGNWKPGGRVKYLESTKGDGVYDKAVTLADDLPFPTGLMAWGKGVLVCAAPDILYLEDTKGTGKADVRKVLFTGFDTSNYQARINGLEYGLDGWVYAANGLLGGKIVSKINPKYKVDLGGRDLRFKPDTGEIEPAAGLTQQGRTRDDWGNWFGNDNSNLLWHYPLPEHYLRRNPHFIAPPARVNVPVGDPDPNKLFPVSHLLRRFNDFGSANRTTSACGPCIYRDTLLGKEYYGNSFTCEPVHNLVTRRVLTPKGVTFVGKRSPDEQDREFFASTDNWCRPVQVRTGPDGGLWVVDMYRFVIEHPRWITPDRLAELDIRAGADMGRIYRIVPENVARHRPERLDGLNSGELMARLGSSNGVQRDLAQRLLIERKDADATPKLKSLVTTGTHFERLHALCTLDCLDLATPDVVVGALRDQNPLVRRHAFRGAGRMRAELPDVDEILLKAVDDPDMGVRFQLACELGNFRVTTAGTALAKLALKNNSDPYFTAAVLSSVNHQNFEWVLATLVPAEMVSESGLLAKVLALAPSLLDANATRELLDDLIFARGAEAQPWQFAAASSLLDAMERRSVEIPASDSLTKLGERAREVAAKEAAPEGQRVAAIRLLGRGAATEADVVALGKLVDARSPPVIQNAAIDRLAQIQSGAASKVLLSDWASKSPDIKARILDALLSREASLGALLDALENGKVRPGDFDATRRQRLTVHRDPKVRERAAKALQGSLDPNRAKIVESYKTVKSMNGDAKAGAQVFAKTCAACHRVGEVGNVIGPDLAALSDRSTDALLIAILDPNRALDGRYAAFNVLTKRGQQFSGMLRSETAASITLVGPEGKKQEILRAEIEELTNTGKSLMPDGLEKDIAPPAMADLVAFLQSIGRPPKAVAGNKPALVKSSADGVLHLRAADCEIHGGDITFEAEFSNLGMWHGENDHAVWSIEVPKPGRYRIELRYACDNGSAGNTLVIQAGDAKVEWRVAGTGRWADYVDKSIGEVELSAGRKQITARPAVPLRGALIDLKEIKFIPK
jgi:putative membrane-bound dehydrogenase-like protein